MTTQDQVTKLLEGLDSLNGEATPEAVTKMLDAATLQERIKREARRRVDLAQRPDYQTEMKDGWQLHQERISRGPDVWTIEPLLKTDSTNILVAPTNVGGSSLLAHLSACLLTGLPFMGTFPTVTDPEARVLWVNPEEMEEEPETRLWTMGLRKGELQRFKHLHTRHQRLYLDRPAQVEWLLEDIDARGWLDGKPTALIIDGLQPTLSGKAWNEELEAWKEGANILVGAVQPFATIVRVQVGATTARYSQGRGDGKEGEHITAEDAIGGQITQWPDGRWTINRRKGGGRWLNVRARRRDPLDIGYDWDSKTWGYQVADVGQEVKAMLMLTQLRDHQPEGVESVRGLAEWLRDRAAASGMDPLPSFETFRRALTKSTWTWAPDKGKWIDTQWEGVADDEE